MEFVPVDGPLTDPSSEFFVTATTHIRNPNDYQPVACLGPLVDSTWWVSRISRINTGGIH